MRKMSYGAPWERGVGAADTMPQRDLEVPGLVPAVDGVGLATKEARRHHSQRERRQRRREEESLRKERSVVDRERCFDVIAEEVDDHRRELKVISRGLDLCESTLCSDVANVRTWVTSALEEQQRMMLRMMNEMLKLGKAIEGSRRARGAEEKIVEEGGGFSRGYGVQEADAPAMEESDKGKAQGTSSSLAGAPCVQAEVCDGGCGSAVGAVGGTPDQPRLPTAPDVHVRGGRGVPPTLAAIAGRLAEAAVTVVGGASVHTDEVGTVSTVLWESGTDVDDRAGSGGDGSMAAASGAAATAGSMQVVEEAIEELDLRAATGCGALPTDGGVWRQLEQELECARSGQAEQVLPGQGCFWEEIDGDGSERSLEGSLEEFTARSDGGFEATGPAEAEGDGDGWCATAVTAAAPADAAGAAIFTGDADNVGASVGADGASGAVAAPEVGQTWADVSGFDLYQTCIVGGDQEMADRGELADEGSKTTGAEETDTEVPISEVAPRPDPGRQYVGRAGGVLQVAR